MTDTERKRLVAILGMLGSASAGERDNAARLAEKFRQQHGLTWADLLAVQEPIHIEKPITEPPPPPVRPAQTISWSRIDSQAAIWLAMLPLVPIFIFLKSVLGF